MEIPVVAPEAGTVASIDVAVGRCGRGRSGTCYIKLVLPGGLTDGIYFKYTGESCGADCFHESDLGKSGL